MAGLPASPPLNQTIDHLPYVHLPAVPAGAVTDAVVGDEFMRKQAISALAALQLATRAEVGQAARREADAIHQVGGGNIAPPWFIAAIAPLQQGVLAAQQAAEGAHQAAQAAEQAMLANSLKLDAMNQNSRIHARNAQATLQHLYERPTKAVTGFMAVLPNPAMNPPQQGMPAGIAAVFTQPPPAPGANVFPPEVLPFPTTPDSSLPFAITLDSSLTQAQVGYLCRWYNDSFGIQPNDPHSTQLTKLKEFLAGR
ncbi:hypothetical protein BJ742DRAFT_823505 [Cladochytrium replicatum]|nr:hypothetical protein BJ742DRAFT_823505 [Cladochytrium replicatum]